MAALLPALAAGATSGKARTDFRRNEGAARFADIPIATLRLDANPAA